MFYSGKCLSLHTDVPCTPGHYILHLNSVQTFQSQTSQSWVKYMESLNKIIVDCNVREAVIIVYFPWLCIFCAKLSSISFKIII